MLSLQGMAAHYQDATGCADADADAVQAAYVMAALLADVVGQKEIGDYFMERAEAVTPEGEPYGPKQKLIDTSYHNPQNWGWY